MNILVVEDVKEQSMMIEKSIFEHYPECDVFSVLSYEAAIEILNSKHFQIFILDIDLGEGPEKSGITLAKYIRTLPGYEVTPILFLTSIPTEMASAINDAHCYSYLLKPYSEESLISSISSLMQTPLLPAETLELKGANGIYFHINPDDIVYIEIFRHNLIIYTDINTFEINNLTISDFCKKTKKQLVQCHKSYAVNPARISGKSSAYIDIILRGKNITIPIGRSFKENINRRI